MTFTLVWWVALLITFFIVAVGATLLVLLNERHDRRKWEKAREWFEEREEEFK